MYLLCFDRRKNGRVKTAGRRGHHGPKSNDNGHSGDENRTLQNDKPFEKHQHFETASEEVDQDKNNKLNEKRKYENFDADIKGNARNGKYNKIEDEDKNTIVTKKGKELDEDNEMNAENQMHLKDENGDNNENEKVDDSDEMENSDKDSDRQKTTKNNAQTKDEEDDDEEVMSKSDEDDKDNIMAHNKDNDKQKHVHEVQEKGSQERKDEGWEDKEISEDRDNESGTRRMKSESVHKKHGSNLRDNVESNENYNENLYEMKDDGNEERYINGRNDRRREKYEQKYDHVPRNKNKYRETKRKENDSWKQRYDEHNEISEEKDKPNRGKNNEENEHDADEMKQVGEKDNRLEENKDGEMDRLDDEVRDNDFRKKNNEDFENRKDKKDDYGTTNDDGDGSGHQKGKEHPSDRLRDSNIVGDGADNSYLATRKESKYDRLTEGVDKDRLNDRWNKRNHSPVVDNDQEYSHSLGEENRQFNMQRKHDHSHSKENRKYHDDNWNNRNSMDGEEEGDNEHYKKDEISHQHRKDYEDRAGNERYQGDGKNHPDGIWNKYSQDEKEGEDNKRYKENQIHHRQQEKDYKHHLGKHRDRYDHLSYLEDNKGHHYDHWNNKNSPDDNHEEHKQHYNENRSIQHHQEKGFRDHKGKQRDGYDRARHSEGKGDDWHDWDHNEDRSSKVWVKDSNLHEENVSDDQNHDYRDKMDHQHTKVPIQNQAREREDLDDNSDTLENRESHLHEKENGMEDHYGKKDQEGPSHELWNKQDDTYVKDNEYPKNKKEYLTHFNDNKGDVENPNDNKSNDEQFRDGEEGLKDDVGIHVDREQGTRNKEKHQNNSRGNEDKRPRIGEANNNDSLNENDFSGEGQQRKYKGDSNGDGAKKKTKQSAGKDARDKGDIRSQINVESDKENRSKGDSRNRLNTVKDGENREKEKVVKNEHRDENKGSDHKDPGSDLNHDNSTKSSLENVNTHHQKTDLRRNHYGREKIEHERTGNKVQHGFKNEVKKPEVSSTKSESSVEFTSRENSTRHENNTDFPVHKKSLYHSLKDLDNPKNKLTSKPKVHQENLYNLHNFLGSDNDIMNVNQNNTTKFGKNSKSSEQQADERNVDSTKYFDQHTREWKEGRKEDDVEDHGKYFNQMTRDWSINQPKKESGEYFHNLTSGWNLKNDTRQQDSEKYFNQRTKQWIGEKEIRNQSNSKHPAQNQQKIPTRNNTSSAEKVLQTRNNKPKIRGNRIENNEIYETKENETVVRDKNYEHNENQTFHISQNSAHKYFQQSGYNKISWKKANEDVSQDREKAKSNQTRAADRFQLLAISKKSRNNKGSFNDVEIFGNKSSAPHSQQNISNHAMKRHKLKNNKWSEEKVRKEILKLIGQEPAETDAPKRNEEAHLNPKQTGFGKTQTLLNHGKSSTMRTITVKKPSTTLTGNSLPNRKAISRMQKPKLKSFSPLALPHHQKKQDWHKSTFLRPSARDNRKDVVKISKNTPKVQPKQLLEGSMNSIQRTRPKSLNKNKHLPVNVSNEKKLLFSKMGNTPKQSGVSKPNKMSLVANKKSQIQKISRRIFAGKSNITATTKNRDSKVFDNSWNREQISVNPTPYTPTMNHVESWNAGKNIFQNGWKDNSYPWPQYYGNANVEAPTVAPISSWNDMNWYFKGNQQKNYLNTVGHSGVSNPNIFITTTPMPVYFNGQVPSGNDGDKNKIGESYWKPEVGNLYWNRQREQNGMNPLSATGTRRNGVHVLTKQNNVELPHIGQTNAGKTAKPTKSTNGLEFNKFLEHVLNVSSFVPQQNIGSNVAKPTSRIKQHPYQNKGNKFFSFCSLNVLIYLSINQSINQSINFLIRGIELKYHA